MKERKIKRKKQRKNERKKETRNGIAVYTICLVVAAFDFLTCFDK